MDICGDDFLASLAESMQDAEDWDDVQAMESEACGDLADMFDKDLFQNYDTKPKGVHVKEDSLESLENNNFMILDSSSDDEKEGMTISRKNNVKPSVKCATDRKQGNSQGSQKPTSISGVTSFFFTCFS